MTEEEQKAIEEMYEEGLVNVSRIAEPLINKYKELDYQQCQFVIEYLLADRQSNEEYVDKLEADIEQLEKNIDNLIKEQEEREKYLHILEENNNKQQKELDLKDKVIDLMAEDIRQVIGDDNYMEMTRDETIEKYYREVEEENEN